MKKVTYILNNTPLKNIRYRRYKRRLSSKKKHDNKLRAKNYHLSAQNKNIYSKHKSKSKSIVFPKTFSIHKNLDNTLKIISNLRQSVDKANITLNNIDFSNTTYVDLSTLLVATAEVDICHKRMQHNIKHNYNKNIAYLLYELGFFDLLGKRTAPVSVQSSSISFLRYQSSDTGDGEKIDNLKNQLHQMTAKSLLGVVGFDFYNSVSEAVNNSIKWAYKQNECYKKWWLSAAYHKKQRIITISLYDRGLTIPHTIRNPDKKFEKTIWQKVRDKIKDSYDVDVIKLAMELSHKHYNSQNKTKSSSGEISRGKGLRQMLEFVENKDGSIYIISGHALCNFSIQNDKLSIKEERKLSTPLSGTLIEWRLKIENN